VVADIHCGPDRDTQLGSRAPALLDELVVEARAFDAHCIVDLGDRINSIAHGQDRVRTVYVRRRLQQAAVPVYHVVGNTDVACLSKDELTVALDKSAPHEIIDLDDVRLVLLDSLDPPIEQTGGAIGEAQRAWLETALHTDRPCIVFCHHPLDEQPLDGHRYFEARPHLAAARARAEARRVFEQAGRVRAVFAGHMHWTRLTRIGAVPYVTLTSLVDCAYTGGEPCNAYALVTVDAGCVDVNVVGLRPARFSLTTHSEAAGG